MIGYLRATLNGSRTTTHTLQAEFDRLRDYLELMAIRMGPRLAFSLQLPPELAQHPVPALLLQPLVENSIQHGLEPKVEGGRVTVNARREGGQLVLEVVDTGVGPYDAARRGHGLWHDAGARTPGHFAWRRRPASNSPASPAAARARRFASRSSHDHRQRTHRPDRRRRAAAGAGAARRTGPRLARSCASWRPWAMAPQPLRRRWHSSPTCSFSTSACPVKAAWTRPWNWPTSGRRTSPSRRWCSSPPTTSTRCRLSKPRPWTTCSSRCRPRGCKRRWPRCRTCWRGAARAAAISRPRWASCAACWARCSAPGRRHEGPLKLIQVSVGTSIRMVPVEEVLYFEAADKYVRVLTQDHEYLIRTPLKELLPQLDTPALLAGASRHGGARGCLRERHARRSGKAAPELARPQGKAGREPAVRAPVQGDVEEGESAGVLIA